jgi:RNA polymerase sigma-70 factor, ECF subfamily
MLAVDADAEQFVQAAQGGSPGAWDRLFHRYQLPLYTYVHDLVRNEQIALDLVQETFVSAVRYLGSLREPGKVGSWLFSIAHQKCLQHWRQQGRERLWLESEGLPEEMASEEDDPGELLVRREQEAAFLRLLDRLPTSQRAVLVLHLVEDFSLEEIATVTGVPVGTVKSRLHYAKKTLRHWLENEDAT